MDKQHRILVPQVLREFVNLDLSKPYALCLEDFYAFSLAETDECTNKKVLDIITLDKKGRFFLATRLIKSYEIPDCAVESIYVYNGRIHISFVDQVQPGDT